MVDEKNIDKKKDSVKEKEESKTGTTPTTTTTTTTSNNTTNNTPTTITIVSYETLLKFMNEFKEKFSNEIEEEKKRNQAFDHEGSAKFEYVITRPLFEFYMRYFDQWMGKFFYKSHTNTHTITSKDDNNNDDGIVV